MGRTDLEIVSEWEESYKQASECWQPFLQQAQLDLNYKAGKQYSDDELAYLKREGRTPLVYNKILRVVNNITGYQRRNRMGLACEPQEGSDLETSDQFSDLLTWNMSAQNGYHTISNAFKGAVNTGINLLDLWLDYQEDREFGDIRITRESFNSFLLDPYWSGDPTFRDCRFITRRRYVDRNQAMALLPEAKNDIKKLKGIRGAGDGKYEFMTYSKKGVGHLLNYDEFYVQRTKPAFLLINRLNNESKIFRGSKGALKGFLNEFAEVQLPTGQILKTQFKEFTEVRETMIASVELNVIVENELMFSGKQSSGIDDYPFVPVVGYYEPELDDYSYKLQGIIRCMRDPQTDLNRQRSKILDMINSKASTGWIYKQGTVVNAKDLFKTGQGVQIVTSKESQPGDLAPIQASDIPQGTFNYTQTTDKEINEIPGVTDENLGLLDAGSQISGTAVKLRQASGTTTLSEFFDNLDLSQKVVGQKMMKLMQLNWEPEKVERILGRPPSREFYDKNFGKYDCVVKETNLTDSQRTLGYIQGLQALQAGVQVPQKFLIEEMPIADKSKLLKAFEEERQKEEELKAKQLEAEEMSKELSNAQKEQMIALAQERRARVISDLSLSEERTSEAAENRSQAALNRAKTMSEIASLENDQVLKVLEFANMLNRQEIVDRESISNKIFNQSARINTKTEGAIENEVIKKKLAPQSSVTQNSTEGQLVNQ